MQFKVPQFLEIEDKIFGPFTFWQFVYLAGGGGMCFILYKVLGFWFGILPILAIAGFSVMLAFYRPNNKPFITMVESGFKYALQDKLYIWKRRKADTDKKTEIKPTGSAQSMYQGSARLSSGKLRDLAWSLDVLDLKKEDLGTYGGN